MSSSKTADSRAPGVDIHRVLTPGVDIQYIGGDIKRPGCPLSLREAWPGTGDYLGPHSGS